MRNSDTPRQVDSGCQDVLRLTRVRICGSAGVVALDVRQSLRFCSGHLRLACVRICGFVGGRLVCVRSSGSAGAVCSARVRPYGFVAAFALDVRLTLRLCRGILRLMCVGFCGSAKAVVCAWCAPDIAALLGWLCSICVSPCGSVAAFCLGSRLSFFLCQEKRDGLRYLAFLFRRVEIAIRAFSWCRCGYLPWRVHFGLVRFFMAIPTGNRGHEEWGYGRTGYGVGGAAFVRFYAATLALLCFPPGVRWGCAPQTCAKESSTLWTLFTLRRGCVGADSAAPSSGHYRRPDRL